MKRSTWPEGTSPPDWEHNLTCCKQPPTSRTRTTRLSAIYLHNVALARLTHACASSAEALNFRSDFKDVKNETRNAAHAADVAKPPEKMTQR
jgi:hypothetical protein